MSRFIGRKRLIQSGSRSDAQFYRRGEKSDRLLGLKFKRQKPIGPYIVDFICTERWLVIELDGGQHQLQTEYDQQRERYLESRGYRVLRFWNHQVLAETEAVLEQIRLEIGEQDGL
nr:endonuclease domain-containing protein [Pseudomonas mendocina]